MRVVDSTAANWAAGFSDQAHFVQAGGLEVNENPPLERRQVLRIDAESDAVVLHLTGFTSGAKMRREFERLRLAEPLALMSHHARVHDRDVYLQQLEELKKSRLGDRRAVERVEIELRQGIHQDLWTESGHTQHRHSRVPEINLFGLVLCIVFGGLPFGVVGVLPYFNLSSQQIALLFHNAIRIVGPALAADWAPPFRSAEWLLDWCGGDFANLSEDESSEELLSSYDGEDDVGRAEQIDRNMRSAILQHDLVLFCDGVDRKSQKPHNMTDQALIYGTKKKTLKFHGLRWIVVTNRVGDIVFRTPAAGHCFAEIDLLLQSGFFETLDESFQGHGKKVTVAFVCDRGYFSFDSVNVNDSLQHITVEVYYPALTNRPYGKRGAPRRTHVTGKEAIESTAVSSLRAFNEIGNLHFAQNRVYQHVIPISMFYLMDPIDDVAFSMANLRAGCPRHNEVKRPMVY
jgi:hypothetical protein